MKQYFKQKKYKKKNYNLTNLYSISLLILLFLCIANPVYMQSSTIINIIDFGAKPDGKINNQLIIQDAIDKASLSDKGIVLIPKGVFLTGTVELKSNVELHLEDDAILLGSTDTKDYKSVNLQYGLIIALNAENISITGKGAINGQGRTLALNIDSLFYAGKIDSANYNFRRKRPNENLRPNLIKFYNCKNIKLKDITLKNSSCWVQTYKECKNLEIKNIIVDSDAYWNNDGIDIVDSKNVIITGCKVNSADDGICLKSENSESSCDSIYISDCVVRSSASAVKFGTASHGGFRNIKINNIHVYDTFRSAIAIESVDGGVIENVEVSNIFAVNTGNAIFIRLGDRIKERNPGVLKDVTISNVRVQIPYDVPDKKYEIRGPELPFFHNQFPASITGIPNYDIENIKLENIEIIYPGNGNSGLAYLPTYRLETVPENVTDYPEFHMFGELPAWAFYVRHVNGISFKNIFVRADKNDYRPAFVFDDVSRVELNGIKIQENKSAKKQIVIRNTKEINFDKQIVDLIEEVE